MAFVCINHGFLEILSFIWPLGIFATYLISWRFWWSSREVWLCIWLRVMHENSLAFFVIFDDFWKIYFRPVPPRPSIWCIKVAVFVFITFPNMKNKWKRKNRKIWNFQNQGGYRSQGVRTGNGSESKGWQLVQGPKLRGLSRGPTINGRQ